MRTSSEMPSLELNNTNKDNQQIELLQEIYIQALAKLSSHGGKVPAKDLKGEEEEVKGDKQGDGTKMINTA